MEARFDAVVLAGGRGSRLGGADKATVTVGGSSLLHRTLAAVTDAGTTIVVGEPDPAMLPGPVLPGPVPPGPVPPGPVPPGPVPPGPVPPGPVRVVQERPRHSGPAAAVGAGLREVRAPWTLIAACDHPFVADAVAALRAAVSAAGDIDGVVAVAASTGRRILVVLARTDRLSRAVDDLGDPAGRSVGELLRRLDLLEVPVGEQTALDVDTWDDRDQAESLDATP